MIAPESIEPGDPRRDSSLIPNRRAPSIRRASAPARDEEGGGRRSPVLIASTQNKDNRRGRDNPEEGCPYKP